MNDNDNKPTLRDRFAMAALPGLLANKDYTDEAVNLEGWDTLAAWAYELADAMLAERDEG